MKFINIILIGLLSALMVLAGCSKPLAGQAIGMSCSSDEDCDRGETCSRGVCSGSEEESTEDSSDNTEMTEPVEQSTQETGYGGSQCTDSDGGKNFVEKGQVEANGFIAEDTCHTYNDGSVYLFEAICGDQKFGNDLYYYVQKKCGEAFTGVAANTMMCVEGKCVKSGSGGGECNILSGAKSSWKVATPTKQFEKGKTINSIYTFIGKDELDSLADGTWTTNEKSYNYQQILFFSDQSGTSEVVQSGAKGDVFLIQKGHPIARYQLEFVEFENPAKSDITDQTGAADPNGKYLDDFINTDLTIFGKLYTIVQATRPATNPKNSIKLVLMAGAVLDTLLEGKTKNYLADDKVYEVTLSYVDDDEVKFTVNGEITIKLKVGDTYVLKDKTQIGVSEILYQSYAEGVHSATFFVGAQKMELRDDNVADQKGDYNLKVDSEDINGATVIIKGTDDTQKVKISSLEVNMVAESDYAVPVCGKLSDTIKAVGGENKVLMAGLFDIAFKGMTGNVAEVYVTSQK